MTVETQVAVVGAGPAGIVTALELAGAGIDVVLIESGSERYDPHVQELGEAATWNRDLHAPMSMAIRRQLGGATTIWGGRCVPYDEVDFDRRPWITDADWPVTYADVAPFFQRACDWFECGRAVFDAAETRELPAALVRGLPNGEVRTSTLERWSLPTNFGQVYRERLRDSRHVSLMTGLTCTRITADGLVCKTIEGATVDVRAQRYVVACGGLESTRLLLVSGIGNHSDHLGRWYMGHVEGVVARLHLTTPPRETLFDYERDVDGVYVRRRITFSREYQVAEELPNIASWIVHPELADAGHRSGVLSFAYLALASPLGGRLAPEALRLAMTGQRVPGVPYGGGERTPVPRHLANIVRQAGPTARFAAGFGARGFLSRGRRAPGFSVYSPANVYPLQYHGEHRPRHDSRVTLADERDAVGMQRLRIDVRFGDADVADVARAHERWDEYLRRHGVGRVEYLVDDVPAAVRERLGAGFHQTGTTRMSARPEEGVVDPELAVHGHPSVHVVSSSVFPTSSQANSTFMIVVFALRLADRLKRDL